MLTATRHLKSGILLFNIIMMVVSLLFVNKTHTIFLGDSTGFLRQKTKFLIYTHKSEKTWDQQSLMQNKLEGEKKKTSPKQQNQTQKVPMWFQSCQFGQFAHFISYQILMWERKLFNYLNIPIVRRQMMGNLICSNSSAQIR